MRESPAALRVALAVYRMSLGLYPRLFRREYGPEMILLFNQMGQEAWRDRGLAGLLLVGLSTIPDLVVSAAEQHSTACQERIESWKHRLEGKSPSGRLVTQLAGLGLLMLPIAVVSSSAFAKVDLTVKHVEGSVSAYRTTTKTHQVLTINATPYETSGASTITTRTNVGQRLKDGTLPLHNRIESIEAALRLPGGIELTFDSEKPDAGTDNPLAQVYLTMFRALSGSSHTAVLDGDNHVIAVYRPEKMLEGAPEPVRNLFGKLLDPRYLKQVSNQELDRLPEAPVRKGDTWTRYETVRLGGGQFMTFTTRYRYLGTVKKLGKKLDQIGITSVGVTYTLDPTSPLPLQVPQSDFAIQSSAGTLWFDRKRGIVVEAHKSDRIQGELTMVINEVESPSSVDLTIETHTVLVN